MTADLGSQLERYTRAVADQQAPISVAEAQGLVGAIRVLPELLPRHSLVSRRGVVIGASAAVVAVLLLAIPALVSLVGDESPATTPSTAATSTSIAPITTTPIEPVTTVVTPALSAAEVSDLPSEETALGTVSWTKVTGADGEIPPAWTIAAVENGSFVAVQFPYVYVSPDGITWTAAAIPTTDDGDVVTPFPSFLNEWLADWRWSTIGAPIGLFRQESDWVSVEVGDEIPDERPAIEGLRWTDPSYRLAVNGAVVVVGVDSRAIVPWGDIYGLETDPSLWPDSEAGQLAIVDSTTGDELEIVDATIVSVDPIDIVFTDSSTGQEIHRVTGPNPGMTEAQIVNGLANVFHTTIVDYSGWWVSLDGGASFRPMNPPWASSDHVDVMSRGIGGFLYATRAATPSGASLEILRSADGETWESLGQPDFAPATGFEGGATIHVHDGMLRAEVTSGGRSTDVWESVDGESWAYLGQAPTAGNLAQHPDLGWVMLGGDENVYVSQDFETWSVLVASPDIDQILGEEGGGAGAKSAGDALFFSAENAASGQRVLWIARLDK